MTTKVTSAELTEEGMFFFFLSYNKTMNFSFLDFIQIVFFRFLLELMVQMSTYVVQLYPS